MTLTREQFTQLTIYWGLVIQSIYPAIDEITDGGGTTIDEKLHTWRHKTFAKPSVEAVEHALLNIVLPALAAQEMAQADKEATLGAVWQRLANSPLADKPPAEIYDLMQARIDGWASLAAAKADMREWFPLMAAAIFHLVRRG